jgi:hypothetical protein
MGLYNRFREDSVNVIGTRGKEKSISDNERKSLAGGSIRHFNIAKSILYKNLLRLRPRGSSLLNKFKIDMGGSS